jgi:hypothetical protein
LVGCLPPVGDDADAANTTHLNDASAPKLLTEKILRAERTKMNVTPTPDILQEAERLTNQAEQLLPCWEELLEQAHVIGEQIREQVQRAAAGTDPSP